MFVYQGFRSLEDIRTKAHLSNTQKIGLKYYEDFLDRMPREEAAAIEKVVMHLLLSQHLHLLLCDDDSSLFAPFTTSVRLVGLHTGEVPLKSPSITLRNLEG